MPEARVALPLTRLSGFRHGYAQAPADGSLIGLHIYGTTSSRTERLIRTGLPDCWLRTFVWPRLAAGHSTNPVITGGLSSDALPR